MNPRSFFHPMHLCASHPTPLDVLMKKGSARCKELARSAEKGKYAYLPKAVLKYSQVGSTKAVQPKNSFSFAGSIPCSILNSLHQNSIPNPPATAAKHFSQTLFHQKPLANRTTPLPHNSPSLLTPFELLGAVPAARITCNGGQVVAPRQLVFCYPPLIPHTHIFQMRHLPSANERNAHRITSTARTHNIVNHRGVKSGETMNRPTTCTGDSKWTPP